ncbi:BaiN/RdsA family NAD(P)/FAD-dependent oxidoreductase [Tissierella creatinophila]|uniref:Dihydrolipoamide dehydrogenase n=1 Tax=Tissierella creatinophila DSM 6911 TaxID=1123403 RepID=A0A1U7M9S9_TISCR|nr:NAD(P)/FAD-dependent oxidoreductase [Tissierella creatinophila]OLS03958.1 dihydrolipoamide dehydrogenase [Tissierella creatinophila DSM 6911]
MKKKIGVIGAGPAGIIASGIASSSENQVYLIEKNNKIGKKLYITGKGRCNVSNDLPIEDFFNFIVSNKNFLYSSLYSFTNENLIELLNKYGVKTKVERGNRIFPNSDKSSDILKALTKFIEEQNVNVLLNTKVKKIINKDNKFNIITEKETLEFDKLILATGGVSYPLTGSTGDGLNFAKELGHSVTELRPSLVPIEIKESFIKDLQGVSLKNVTLKSFSGKKQIYESFGEMIFTHFGISGPIVLSSSSYINKYQSKDLRFEIDFKPALNNKQLDERILKDFEIYNNKQFKNALNDLLPQRIIPIIISNSNIEGEKTVNQITKLERENLVKAIKGMPLTFKKLRPIEEAIITSGGINIKEINPSTMESLIVKNLFFAGEIIDVDALTGGFNLQIAFSTGFLAGNNV